MPVTEPFSLLLFFYACMCRIEKIKLLENFNRSLEGDAPGTSSVLVKDMIGGNVAF